MKALLAFLFISLPVFAQDFDQGIYEEDPQIYREEGSPYSEVNPPYSDEVPSPEYERQEEEYFNEAPVDSDWSLEGEDLPVDEYQY